MDRAADPTGLTSAEALRRLAEHGPNAVAESAPPAWRAFLAKFWAPVPWLLEAAVVLQIGLHEYVEAGVIAALLLFNVTLAFVQEGRASTALAALRQRLAPTALVRRDGRWVRLPGAEVVPGDVVRLALGAAVPADATIVSGSVTVDVSMLTGESVPVDAAAGASVHGGSLVRRGQAVAEVTATGAGTLLGRTAELVRAAHPRSTEQAAIFAVTRNLAIVNGTFAILLVAGAHWLALPTADLVRLALTALLATIPVALPATFTLSAAFGARILARHGVLLTRLSAAHEAAAMDVLCADKTGTLTRNALEVVDVLPLGGEARAQVLRLAALASSEADQDPIDAAVREAAGSVDGGGARLVRFIPFDPTTRRAEAVILDESGRERRVLKGAFVAIAEAAQAPADARRLADALSGQGHRVLAVASGPIGDLRMVGLVALSDPPRPESAELIATLRDMGVRTLMVTGDSPATATAIAAKVGIRGAVIAAGAPPESIGPGDVGVYARVLPEDKFRLVEALQSQGHAVGMCGDGTNDAPALRQAQIGIAVSTATDAAKAAAGMVLTEPGLAGIVLAVREGRIAFQRLRAYALNMLTKKIEIVLLLAIGLAMTGHAVMTPALMVLMLVTNDFLAMSLTTDRASPSSSPSAWHMRNVTLTALVLGSCKLAFSVGVLALGLFRMGLDAAGLQTLAFTTLVFGSQAVLYVVRERRALWHSRPGTWVLLASTADIGIVVVLARWGVLMEPLPWHVLGTVLAAAAAFAVVLDQVKLRVLSALKIA
jgi:H+-transporting ATPase